ncbi:MAG: FitA-like ribbon-helix-helix domain-containing protein [Gammaproteobacteria bacterium]
MPVLNIRNLPAEVHARLRIRAAEAHRSMEAEARAILTEACSSAAEPRPAHELPDWVDKLYGRHKPVNVVDDFITERRRESARE